MQPPYPVHLNWGLERMKQLQQQRFADWHQPTDHQLAFTSVSNLMLCRSIQLAPIMVSNAGLYRFNSKIRDNCKCIPKRLIALASSTQLSPTQSSPTPVPSVQVPLAQAQASLAPMIEAHPIQAPLVLVSSTQALLIQAPLVLASLTQAPMTEALPI